MTRLAVKRVYDPAAPTDGTRILVDRLWPRGIAREKIGLWLKDDVLPPASAPGGIELSFTEPDRDAVYARAEAFLDLGFVDADVVGDADHGALA